MHHITGFQLGTFLMHNILYSEMVHHLHAHIHFYSHIHLEPIYIVDLCQESVILIFTEFPEETSYSLPPYD